MSTYFPLIQPTWDATVPVSFARNWEIFVRPRGGSEDEKVTVYAAGEDGAATLTQPLVTDDKTGLIGDGERFGWIKGADLPVDLWGRPKGRDDINWQVLPEGDQAIVAGGLAGENIAVVKEAPLNVEYAEYGADGSRATDSSEAFQKAIKALPSEGGEIFAPRLYKLGEPLDLEGKRAVRIHGQAGIGTGNDSRSQLLFTSGSAGGLINARNANGVVIHDLQVEYTSESQTGPVVDCQEAFKPILERVAIAGSGVSAALGIDLDKAECGSFRDLKFSGLDVGVKGKASDESFSNVMTFEGLVFNNIGTVAVNNGGESWNLRNVTAEPLTGNAAGFYAADEGVRAYGMVFDSCWTGDAGTSGTQILWRGKGLTIRGGSIGSGKLGVSVPDATSEGVSISGVRFISLTDAIRLASGVKQYLIAANAYESSVSGKKVSLDGGTTDSGAGFLADE